MLKNCFFYCCKEYMSMGNGKFPYPTFWKYCAFCGAPMKRNGHERLPSKG